MGKSKQDEQRAVLKAKTGGDDAMEGLTKKFFATKSVPNEYEYLKLKTGLSGSVNDLKVKYLKSLGYSGTIDEMFDKSIAANTYYV
jgi:hypothetical protein